jgi:hypothetical protein
VPSEPPDIWTIGHSTHAFESFLALLRGVGVTALADVRTAPYSRRSSHFNRDEHILPDGETVSQPEIEDKLLQLAGQGADDLVEPRNERLAKAYRDRARKIAFPEPTLTSEKPAAASRRI